MGTLLGHPLANGFICHFEKQWLSGYLQDFSLILTGGTLMIFLSLLTLIIN